MFFLLKGDYDVLYHFDPSILWRLLGGGVLLDDQRNTWPRIAVATRVFTTLLATGILNCNLAIHGGKRTAMIPSGLW